MSDEYDWLDEKPARKQLVAKLKGDPHYRELEGAFNGIKGLTAPRKKLYLLCYLQAAYDPRQAAKLYEHRIGEKPKLAQWRKDDAFKTAVELAESSVYRALGISVASVLAMTREALDEARLTKDPQATARFLDMLGKHLKMWNSGEDQSAREGPALNINIITPDRPTIDVTPEQRRVTIDVPRPEKN